jgi:hypothetical protein
VKGVEALGAPTNHHSAVVVVVDVEGGRAPCPPPPPPCRPHECRREACLDPSVAIQSSRRQLDQ